MAHKKTSPTMLKALTIAAHTGQVRRLPGGYWVRSDASWTKLDRAGYDGGEWIGTTTVASCVDRGFLTWQGDLFANLTGAGRDMIGKAV